MTSERADRVREAAVSAVESLGEDQFLVFVAFHADKTLHCAQHRTDFPDGDLEPAIAHLRDLVGLPEAIVVEEEE